MAEKKDTQEAELTEVTVQTAPAFKIGEEIVDERGLLLSIYNKILKIEKAVA